MTTRYNLTEKRLRDIATDAACRWIRNVLDAGGIYARFDGRVREDLVFHASKYVMPEDFDPNYGRTFTDEAWEKLEKRATQEARSFARAFLRQGDEAEKAAMVAFIDFHKRNNTVTY